jgi:uncharacterized protein (TIGR03067 family)
MKKVLFAVAALVLALLVTRGASAQGGPGRGLPRNCMMQAVSATINGEAVPAAKGKMARLKLDGNNFALQLAGRTIAKGRYKVDPSQTPKAIDMTFTGGLGQGLSVKGIYEVKGDTLKLCHTPPGQARPTEFSSRPGSGQRLSVWQLDKKKKARASRTK